MFFAIIVARFAIRWIIALRQSDLDPATAEKELPMLIPTLACMAAVLSCALPCLGLMLVTETCKPANQSAHLTIRTKQDRLKWAALGWVILVIGVCLAPVPYVTLALAESHGATLFLWVGAFFLLLVQCVAPLDAGEALKKARVALAEHMAENANPFVTV